MKSNQTAKGCFSGAPVVEKKSYHGQCCRTFVKQCSHKKDKCQRFPRSGRRTQSNAVSHGMNTSGIRIIAWFVVRTLTLYSSPYSSRDKHEDVLTKAKHTCRQWVSTPIEPSGLVMSFTVLEILEIVNLDIRGNHTMSIP